MTSVVDICNDFSSTLYLLFLFATNTSMFSYYESSLCDPQHLQLQERSPQYPTFSFYQFTWMPVVVSEYFEVLSHSTRACAPDLQLSHGLLQVYTS